MPFTISHIAAVLPAHRTLRRLGMYSAAIIGSMVPDFGMLMPVHLTRVETHGSTALLAFCLPVGMAAWWLFQLLIKPAWSAVMPAPWHLRLWADHAPLRFGDWRAWLGAAVAILLGALTHLVWDAFTHEGGRGVSMFPFLDDTFGPELTGHPLRLYRWLQLGSSVLGLIAVCAASLRWARAGVPLRAPEARALPQTFVVPPGIDGRERLLWQWAFVLMPLLLVVPAALWLEPSRYRVWTTEGAQITGLAVASLIALAFSLVLVSALVRWRVARHNRSLDA